MTINYLGTIHHVVTAHNPRSVTENHGKLPFYFHRTKKSPHKTRKPSLSHQSNELWRSGGHFLKNGIPQVINDDCWQRSERN